MKKIISISFLLSVISAGIVCAQKVDLDKQAFTYKYRRHPNKVLDPSYKTYSVEVRKTVALDAYSNETVNERIRIEGRKKIQQGGHIQIIINLEDLIFASNQVKEHTEIYKDKEGKETSRKTNYWIEIQYTFAASCNISDNKGVRLSSYTLDSRNPPKLWKSGEYESYNTAAKFYDDNKLEIKTKLVTDQINAAINQLNSSLAYDFGYSTRTETELLWKMGSKKHIEFDAYNQAIETTKSSLEKITADELPANIMTNLEPAIKYFESLPLKYSALDDKMLRKLRYGAYYNLASIYLYTENFDKANEFADKLIANDYDPKDGERINKEIETVKERLSKHSAQTRHFIPDYLTALAPDEN